MKIIDFFCGCGGASKGFQQAGFDIALGIDFDESAAESYQAKLLPPNAPVFLMAVLAIQIPSSAAPSLFVRQHYCKPFPKPFSSRGNRGHQSKQIGNAVPVLLAQRFAEAMWQQHYGQHN